MMANLNKLCVSLILVMGFTSFTAHAQIDPVSEGVNWQRTVRVMSVIEPFDSFNQMLQHDRIGAQPDEILTRENIHFSNVAANFWEVFRDSLSEAIKNDEINVYSVRPAEIRGQQNIYVKNEQIDSDQLPGYLSDNFDRVVSSQFSGAAAQSAPFFFSNFQNRIVRVSQAAPDFENLEDVNLFQLELVFYHDETGFGIKPTTLIFAPALFNSEADYEDNRPVEIFPHDFAFMIDLQEESSIAMLNEKGIPFSGEKVVVPFHDLLSLLQFDYFYYSVSRQDLFTRSQRDDNDLSLEELRASVKNYFNELIFEFTYGQVPGWWIDSGKGALTNGLFEITDTYRERIEGSE